MLHSQEHINRSRRAGYTLYCSRTCAGLGRRSGKTDPQKKAEKCEYDKQRRANNKERMKAEKAAYHKRTYDPAKARIERKKRSEQHAEYCRQPAYRAWKKKYDKGSPGLLRKAASELAMNMGGAFAILQRLSFYRQAHL